MEIVEIITIMEIVEMITMIMYQGILVWSYGLCSCRITFCIQKCNLFVAYITYFQSYLERSDGVLGFITYYLFLLAKSKGVKFGDWKGQG